MNLNSIVRNKNRKYVVDWKKFVSLINENHEEYNEVIKHLEEIGILTEPKTGSYILIGEYLDLSPRTTNGEFPEHNRRLSFTKEEDAVAYRNEMHKKHHNKVYVVEIKG